MLLACALFTHAHTLERQIVHHDVDHVHRQSPVPTTTPHVPAHTLASLIGTLCSTPIVRDAHWHLRAHAQHNTPPHALRMLFALEWFVLRMQLRWALFLPMCRGFVVAVEGGDGYGGVEGGGHGGGGGGLHHDEVVHIDGAPAHKVYPAQHASAPNSSLEKKQKKKKRSKKRKIRREHKRPRRGSSDESDGEREGGDAHGGAHKEGEDTAGDDNINDTQNDDDTQNDAADTQPQQQQQEQPQQQQEPQQQQQQLESTQVVLWRYTPPGEAQGVVLDSRGLQAAVLQQALGAWTAWLWGG